MLFDHVVLFPPALHPIAVLLFPLTLFDIALYPIAVFDVAVLLLFASASTPYAVLKATFPPHFHTVSQLTLISPENILLPVMV